MKITYNKNGISYGHSGKGKWTFSGKRPNGETFTKVDAVKGKENAEKVAVAIGASLKRNFAGIDGIDNMAEGQIRKIIKPKTYAGNNLSFAGEFGTRTAMFCSVSY